MGLTCSTCSGNALSYSSNNDIQEIYDAIETAKSNTTDKPTAIIANTIKGKGVSFMEDSAAWHGKAPNDEQFEKALAELKG